MLFTCECIHEPCLSMLQNYNDWLRWGRRRSHLLMLHTAQKRSHDSGGWGEMRSRHNSSFCGCQEWECDYASLPYLTKEGDRSCYLQFRSYRLRDVPYFFSQPSHHFLATINRLRIPHIKNFYVFDCAVNSCIFSYCYFFGDSSSQQKF
jgi:hypothetical protein